MRCVVKLLLFLIVCQSLTAQSILPYPSSQKKRLTIGSLVYITPSNVDVMPALKETWDSLDAVAKQKFASPGYSPRIPAMKDSMLTRFYKDGGLLTEFTLYSGLAISMAINGRGFHLQFEFQPRRPDGAMTDASEVAKNANARYVLELPSITIRKLDSRTVMQAYVTLYDTTEHRIVFQDTLEGDLGNGDDPDCVAQPVSCLIKKTGQLLVSNIYHEIERRDSTIRRMDRVDVQRSDMVARLFTSHSARFDKELKVLAGKTGLKDAVPFFSLASSDSTRFILFVEDTNQQPTSFRALYALYDRGEWHSLGQGPYKFDAVDNNARRTKAIVSFINDTYFADQSADVSTTFWESGMFRRVSDITLDPLFAEDPDRYASEALRNRRYLGWYAMSAETDKVRMDDSCDQRTRVLTKTKFKPLLKKMKREWIPRQYHLESEYIGCITSPDMQVWIAPVVGVKPNGVFTARFFVWHEGEKKMYRWTRIPETELVGILPDALRKSMAKVCLLDYSLSTYEDDKFWKEDVLAKEGGRWKYLTEVR